MNQDKIISFLAKSTGLTKEVIKKVLQSYSNLIVDSVASGDPIVIQNVVKIEAAEQKERNGVNPQTGAKILIPATKRAKFTTLKFFKMALKSLEKEAA